MTSGSNYFAWSYPAEKFGAAVEVLTLSFAPNWERMKAAVMHVSLLLPSHFPDQDLYERTERLIREASAFGPILVDGETVVGSFENTLRRRRRSTFERLALEIFEIEREIERRRGDDWRSMN